MMKKLIIIFVALMIVSGVSGQVHHEEPIDTVEKVHSIKGFLLKGHSGGHIRNFFGSTNNQGELTDYWANATGGALHYQTANYKGFEMGVKGIFTFNTGSADLNAADPSTGKSAKWEKELFDVNHPEEKYDLDRLEELYLRYTNKWLLAEIGKFDLDKTPLINRRDGRMKPFVFEGIWSEMGSPANKVKIGLIRRVSPRAMTEYFSLEEAIGLNNNGYQTDGSKAHYHEATRPEFLGILGYHHKFGERWSADVWDFYLDNLVNVNWGQIEYHGDHVFAGGQYVFEVALPEQRDIDYNKRYYQPNEHANILSGRLGWREKSWSASLNYLHSFATGRFVFPREFGRERLYTSMPRSWLEGLGNADVFTIKAKYSPLSVDGLTIKTGITAVNTQGKDRFEFNKYNLWSYYQWNILTSYAFHGFLDGLNAELQYFLVRAQPGEEITPVYLINKANYHGINLILNVNF